MSPAVVLTTVNAPYSQQLDALELAYYLLHPEEAVLVPGHMSSFFGEVAPDLQLDFAKLYNITEDQLSYAAKTFADFSGESYPLAA